MITRKFNYTGRKKIPRRCIRLRATPGREDSVSVDVDASGLEIPDGVRFYLEAVVSGSPQTHRFDLGELSRSGLQAEADLSGVVGDNMMFAVKAVAHDGFAGRLVGLAENLRAAGLGDVGEDSALISLLPVCPEDLGDEVWRLEFEHDRPWLLINNRIEGIKELVRTDPQFFALVFPQVIRQVLTRILVIEECLAPPGDDSATDQWLRWAIHWHGDMEFPPEDRSDLQGVLGWIEEVARCFCEQKMVRSRFMDATGRVEAEAGQ
jgi:hypothetical protein